MNPLCCITFITVVALAFCALVGCSGEPSGQQNVDSQISNPNPEGLLTPRPVISQFPSDSDITKLAEELETAKKTNPILPVVPGVGVGTVKFGMSQSEVIAEIGDPHRITGSAYEYQNLGYAVMFDRENKVNAFVCGAWCPPSDILLDVFKGVTQEGIHLRSSMEEVTTAYGQPLTRKDLDKDFVVFHYKLIWLAFRDGKLVHMTLRKPKDIPDENQKE